MRLRLYVAKQKALGQRKRKRRKCDLRISDESPVLACEAIRSYFQPPEPWKCELKPQPGAPLHALQDNLGNEYSVQKVSCNSSKKLIVVWSGPGTIGRILSVIPTAS